MNRYLLFIAVAALVAGIAADSLCDHLQFHFGQGITEGLDQESYWYPDGSRKYDHNGQRYTVFGWRSGWKPVDMMLRIPALMYDGWHLMKILRWFFLATAMWAWGFYWYEPSTSYKHRIHIVQVLFTWIWFIAVFGLIVWIFHPLFFEGVYR